MLENSSEFCLPVALLLELLLDKLVPREIGYRGVPYHVRVDIFGLLNTAHVYSSTFV